MANNNEHKDGLDLTDMVRQALENAAINGYDMGDKSPAVVAWDLKDYDSDLGDEDFQEIVTAVHSIRMDGERHPQKSPK